MRIVMISDTHLQHDFTVPDGDLLIHAGDLTFNGGMAEVTNAAMWLKAIRVGGGYKDAVVIPGNHDWMAERDPVMMRNLIEEAGWHYLQHQAKEIAGLRFFGSGYTPRFYDWALNVDRGPELARLWAQIPDDTQVLVTHGPPYGRLDEVKRPAGEMDAMDFGSFGAGKRDREHQRTRVGCVDLMNRCVSLKDLKLHVFGHIHGPGMEKGANGVTYVNASSCNEQYKAVHAPQVIDL